MTAKRSVVKKHFHHYKDGSIWAKGQTIDGVPTGRTAESTK